MTRKILASLLCLSLWAAPAQAGTALAPQIRVSQPQILTLHQQVFTQEGSLAPLLESWSLPDPALPADQRAARELIVQAVNAPSLEAAGELIFGETMDSVPQQMAAEAVLQLRGELRPEPPSAPSAEAAAQSKLDKSPAFADLRKALEAWKPKSDAVSRIQELEPAVLAWRSAYSLAFEEPAAAESSVAGAAQLSAAESWQRKGRNPVLKKTDEEPAAKGETVPMSEVMVGVFDGDDNLWLNVNGVWVFKKGTNHQEYLRIPSEEFAAVRASVGKSGKYADYEYWDDRAQGSLKEFFAQPGRNPLLENLKKTVSERRMVDWQGRSFESFAYMLGVNPKGVHILTASGLPAEMFLEALQFLKDEGYIPAVPPKENIHCVGNPEHPYYAATASPAKGKLLTMKHLILDPAQKAAQALKKAKKKAPLLFNADGTRRAHVVPVGFSDDDKGNIAGMTDGVEGEKGLTAEVAAGAWPDLKITLFDSNRADPSNMVIKRDGTLREMTVEEYGETFLGEDAATALPAPEIVRSDRPDAWSAIKKLYFTTDAPGFSHEKVETDVDQTKLESGKLREFLHRPPRKPGWKKRFVMVRYSISDKEMKEVMKESKTLGIPGDLITDFNTSMQVAFGPDEKTTFDFSRAKPKDDEAGQFIKGLVEEGGWAIQGPGLPVQESWGIYSKQLDNRALLEMPEIFHKKGLIMVETSPDGLEQHIEYIEGSGNLAHGGHRVNVLIETDEPHIGAYALKNAERFKEAFRQGHPIDQMRPIQPQLILFGDDKKAEDSEWIYLGNTDGRFNLNDFFADLIQKTLDDPKNFEYMDEDHYEFVWTYGRGAKVTAAALAAFPNSKLYLVADQKFTTLRGWGKTPIMGGYLALHDNGFIDLPWPWDIRKRVEGYDYLRPIPGAVQKDLDGYPDAVFLLHTKIGQLTRKEYGREWLYSKLGSFNYSNKKANAESMWVVRGKAGSPLHGVIRGLMMAHVKAHPEWAVPLWRAPFREVMARVVGRRPLDLILDNVSVLESALKGKQWTVLAFKLQELLGVATTLVRDTLPPDAAQANILRLVKLLAFYAVDVAEMTTGGPGSTSINVQKAASAAMTLAYKQNNEHDIKTVLRSFLYERTLMRDQLTALIDQVYELLGFSQHIRTMQELQKLEDAQTEGGKT